MRRAIRSCLAAAIVAGFLAAGGGQASAAPVSARWSVNVAPASAVTGPEVGGGRVYVGFATAAGTGGVRALDVVTGRTLWTHPDRSRTLCRQSHTAMPGTARCPAQHAISRSNAGHRNV